MQFSSRVHPDALFEKLPNEMKKRSQRAEFSQKNAALPEHENDARDDMVKVKGEIVATPDYSFGVEIRIPITQRLDWLFGTAVRFKDGMEQPVYLNVEPSFDRGLLQDMHHLQDFLSCEPAPGRITFDVFGCVEHHFDGFLWALAPDYRDSAANRLSNLSQHTYGGQSVSLEWRVSSQNDCCVNITSRFSCGLSLSLA